jgi:nucleoside 2-deoxyribosyltransferase
MTSLIYLAGPITGLSYGGCTDWRAKAKELVGDTPIEVLSPMRGKTYLAGETTVGDSYDQFVLSTEKAITARDRFDCMRSDLVIFNFLGAEKASVGSCIEVGWADAFRKPSILILDKDVVGNPHDHAMVRAICGWRVSSLEEAIAVAKAVLLPGV